jgi:hypothetical protein
MSVYTIVTVNYTNAENEAQAVRQVHEDLKGRVTMFVREDNDGTTLDSDQLLDRGYTPLKSPNDESIKAVQALLCAKWNIPATLDA